ncbi:Crp/Fnr family transcriptional regulator [uncultured Phenylobacterium sp.]|uniref:Crp/Fnr family transcriptional regulator n=1 Tax=uncultured Phenylobacterium sp. TaxID=349273 RepID=UPI0025F52F7F|nr:Crp/Fnr family transcriptional regulator [uncultured Phenylobacterium sp.]
MPDLLFRRLLRRDPVITEAERQALAAAISHQVTIEADAEIVREHQVTDSVHLLLSGWACRSATLGGGRRRIQSLHIGGDFIDLQGFTLKRMDYSALALTACRLAVIPHANLRVITETLPHLTRLLWLTTVIDAAIQRQWLLGAGQRSALQRLAHLLCEALTRLEVGGLNDGRCFRLPLTQGELGDTLGMSLVHANRVVGELRSRGLVRWRGEQIEILDWPGLVALAEFDPAYLELEQRDR